MSLRIIRWLARAHTVQGRDPVLASHSSVVEPLLQSWAVWDFEVLLETVQRRVSGTPCCHLGAAVSIRRLWGHNAARLGLGSGNGRYVLFGARFEAQTAVRRTEMEN